MKLIKFMLLIIMAAGIVFSLFNFISVKSEAFTLWQDLETGIDPALGTPYVKCFGTGQACITVYPFEN